MGESNRRPEGFDGAAAVTRSLLGYGVIAGAFYLVVGLALALTRDGFDLLRHPLSLLMLGDGGWMQQANLVLTGLMTVAAGAGITRALRDEQRGARTGAAVVAYGVCLVGSGIFRPDPMAGFPPGAAEGEASLSGILHLAFGGIGFLALAGAGLLLGGGFAQRDLGRPAALSRAGGAVVLVGFVAGAALAESAAGVAALWLAVVVGWVWVAAGSLHLYRWVPHPDPDRRVTPS